MRCISTHKWIWSRVCGRRVMRRHNAQHLYTFWPYHVRAVLTPSVDLGMFLCIMFSCKKPRKLLEVIPHARYRRDQVWYGDIIRRAIKDIPFLPQAGHQFLPLNYSGVTTLLENSCLLIWFLWRRSRSRLNSVTDLVHVSLCVSHCAWQITTVLMLKDAFRACKCEATEPNTCH